MFRPSQEAFLATMIALSVGTPLLGLNGCGGNMGSPAPPSTATPTSATYAEKFQHVVVIVQENRSVDNLFRGLPNADVATSGMNSQGQTIPLTAIPLETNFDLDHSHNAFEAMYDGGTMDGADQITIFCSKGATNCPPPNAPFSYVDPSDVQPYFQLAETYTFADRMFQTNQGPSFPAHQFIIAGTSAPAATSNLFAAENPDGSATAGAGCAAPPASFVALIDPLGNESSTIYPCFEHSTLMDLLDAKMIDWRYYAPSATSIWTGPDAIQHIRNGPDWGSVVLNQKQVLTDIANNQLAQVTWVIPDGADSDHPTQNLGTGPSWVSSIVNALGGSAYWPNTVVFITWDDWGGWYDHVPPQIYDYGYGFRVPLIVASPYAKAGYVSHVTHDFGSILKFIEETSGPPSLGYADARADDLAECFDLNQTPINFTEVGAKYDAKYLLARIKAPTPPDTD